MPDIGVKREVDPLGRIVIPVEIRELLNLPKGAAVSIHVEEDRIILKRNDPCCGCCGGVGKELINAANGYICRNCLIEANKKAGIH